MWKNGCNCCPCSVGNPDSIIWQSWGNICISSPLSCTPRPTHKEITHITDIKTFTCWTSEYGTRSLASTWWGWLVSEGRKLAFFWGKVLLNTASFVLKDKRQVTRQTVAMSVQNWLYVCYSSGSNCTTLHYKHRINKVRKIKMAQWHVWPTELVRHTCTASLCPCIHAAPSPESQ